MYKTIYFEKTICIKNLKSIFKNQYHFDNIYYHNVDFESMFSRIFVITGKSNNQVEMNSPLLIAEDSLSLLSYIWNSQMQNLEINRIFK